MGAGHLEVSLSLHHDRQFSRPRVVERRHHRSLRQPDCCNREEKGQRERRDNEERGERKKREKSERREKIEKEEGGRRGGERKRRVQ